MGGGEGLGISGGRHHRYSRHEGGYNTYEYAWCLPWVSRAQQGQKSGFGHVLGYVARVVIVRASLQGVTLVPTLGPLRPRYQQPDKKLRFIHQLDYATSGVLCLGFTRCPGCFPTALDPPHPRLSRVPADGWAGTMAEDA